MKLAVALVALTTVLTFPALAQHRGYGFGNKSCASWLTDETSTRLGAEWIAGAWSGINAVNPAGARMVGGSTDVAGIIGEVKVVCSSTPSMALSEATMRAWAVVRQREMKQ